METIRIRRAGYPIRHLFTDFVDRYRILAQGIGPSHHENCRSATMKICQTVLGTSDFQLGRTKVFLKVTLDTRLVARHQWRSPHWSLKTEPLLGGQRTKHPKIESFLNVE